MPALPYRATPPEAAAITIPPISPKHHGRSLEILGHAADYLGTEAAEGRHCPCEAIHILKCLGREVFDDYAGACLHQAA